MYALRPPSTDLATPRKLKPLKRRRIVAKHKQQSSYFILAVESIAKLSVNVVLSAVGIAGLMQLIPYRNAQAVKLQELEAAVDASEHRLQKTRSMFSNVFDPYRATVTMQEQGNRIAGERKQIIFQNSAASTPVQQLQQQ
jgi:hypothetical protein